MEKKTFMRRPLDELIGQNHISLKINKEELLDYCKWVAATNHERKKILWRLYLRKTRLT